LLIYVFFVASEAINLKDEVASLKNQGMDGLEEDMLQEIYKQTTDVSIFL